MALGLPHYTKPEPLYFSSTHILTWRFPKMGVHPNHPKLDHFTIKTYGFGDPPF
jgi:hypothetical protein